MLEDVVRRIRRLDLLLVAAEGQLVPLNICRILLCNSNCYVPLQVIT